MNLAVTSLSFQDFYLTLYRFRVVLVQRYIILIEFLEHQTQVPIQLKHNI